jgi:RNA ligase (TIGR02306 family)
MAELKCEVVELEIHDHPNADAIEIAQVRGYQSIVKKGQFKTGDLAVYIPEQSVVPPWVLRRLNMWDDEQGKGGLAGSKGNRVKAIKLRGVLSQGLLLPLEDDNQGNQVLENKNGVNFYVCEGQDVTDLLGVVKYEPPIPVHMSGEVVSLHGKTLRYDIENIKNYPHVAEALINLSIPVEITEKLHGTFCVWGVYPEDIHDEIPYRRVIVTSKGLSAKGLAFKDNDANENNLYMRMFKKLFPTEEQFRLHLKHFHTREPVFFLGEIFGKGVQDLQYGLNDIEFRLFDVYEGKPGQGEYLPRIYLHGLVEDMELPFSTVPVLYSGPLTQQVIYEYTDGMDTVTGSHIREGIVIRPLEQEYHSPDMGRVILKSVSEKYLNRKNPTEYN